MQHRVTLAWNKTHEVNPRVKVNLWLVNPWVNLHMEQMALMNLQAVSKCNDKDSQELANCDSVEPVLLNINFVDERCLFSFLVHQSFLQQQQPFLWPVYRSTCVSLQLLEKLEDSIRAVLLPPCPCK